MEKNKLDVTQLIGFLFLIAAFIWLFMFQPEIEDLDSTVVPATEDFSQPERNNLENESNLNTTNFQRSKVEELIKIENQDLRLVFSTKGAQITEAVLKNYNRLDGKNLKINDANQIFSFNSDNLDTSKIYFSYDIYDNNLGKEINFFYNNETGERITFTYFLPNNGFLLSLDVKTSGYNKLINSNSQIDLNWSLDSFQHSKSEVYENRYTYLNYQDDDEDVRDLSAYSDDDEVDSAKWISYSQHFFNSILIFDVIKDNIEFKSFNLDKTNLNDGSNDGFNFLKSFQSKIPITLNSRGEIEEKYEWYIGPNDYYVIKDYDYGISDSIWFGWGIFGWINQKVFFPLYKFLSSHFSSGVAIIILVILTRLVMSPVQYKMYLSQAKMKILRPEITAATEKFKDDPMKRQQETMKIYNQAGANPLQGCLPAFIQLPVFYALFCFFPVAFALRGESFLWVNDLSSYHVVFELPFYLPLYGDHVSLFPILAGLTMFIYTSMQGTQQMQPAQPGMPNMKYIMYFIPFTLIIFFNSFAAGLSLYYTVSNILTVIIMLTIKNVILDEKKILLQIEENKKKPKTEGRFQRRLRKLQEAAEKAQKLQNQRNK